MPVSLILDLEAEIKLSHFSSKIATYVNQLPTNCVRIISKRHLYIGLLVKVKCSGTGKRISPEYWV
jgi:hypothetical protein